MIQTIKINKYILVVLSVIILAVFAGVGFFLCCLCICCKKESFTKELAISAIKKKYAHMSDFPYEGLTPKSVVAEKYQNDWYVAFVQEGSGRPIIEARCFIVKPSGDVIENGKFIPKLDDNNDSLNFSARKCENSE